MCSETTGVHWRSFLKNIGIKFDDKYSKKKLITYAVVTLKHNLSMLKSHPLFLFVTSTIILAEAVLKLLSFVLSLFKGLNTKALCRTGVSYTT